ncbi:hypothetical protein CMV_014475 [Castanea mollissima]|uniref:BED-type domain-containing protein n=1 Tax=Castanea mollissima TaxID=60419 RepID=A0A8J4QW19_9ROSI|nr:hypothetical protein CMV_014475 [Castanea mollissima]
MQCQQLTAAAASIAYWFSTSKCGLKEAVISEWLRYQWVGEEFLGQIIEYFSKTQAYVMELSNDLAVKKPKRLTSVVWNHFERVRKADICYAVCIHCNKRLSGSSNSGTTHLRNHLMRCLKRSSTIDVSQLLAAKRRKKDTTVSLANISFDEGQRKDDYIKPTILKFDQEQKKDEIFNLGSGRFDQERSRIDLARMIIVHGYPLAMVDHVGFKVFVKNLQPLFEVVPNNSVEQACMEIYGKEKLKVYETINKLHGRINLSVEMWSSPENVEYLCLTAHYIDEDWKLQKKILSFVTLDSSHTEDMLSDVINKCLMDWDVDRKLFALTFDNCSTDDDIVIRIKEQISHKRPLLSTGQLYDVRSAAHVLNSIVQDAMEALREVTQKIRASVKYVKSSQVTQGKFNEISQEVGINSEKNLLFDCPIRWNSTYLMLETALEYRGAFSLLQEHDPDYISALTDTEWEWASSVTGYLKLFLEITNVFSANKFPTANMYFPEIGCGWNQGMSIHPQAFLPYRFSLNQVNLSRLMERSAEKIASDCYLHSGLILEAHVVLIKSIFLLNVHMSQLDKLLSTTSCLLRSNVHFMRAIRSLQLCLN